MSSTTDSNQGIILDAVSWTFYLFTFIIFCMRLYVDVLILRSPRLDTYIASFTFVGASTSASRPVIRPSNSQPQLIASTSQVFTTLSVYHGMGQHLNSLSAAQTMYSLRWSWMAQILQLLANTTGKIAVITYLNNFQGLSRAKAKHAYLWTLGLLQIASTLVLIVFILIQCSPVQKLWNEAIPGACNGRVRNQNFAFFQGSRRCTKCTTGRILMLMRSRSFCSHRYMPRSPSSDAFLEHECKDRKENCALRAFRIWPTVSPPHPTNRPCAEIKENILERPGLLL